MQLRLCTCIGLLVVLLLIPTLLLAAPNMAQRLSGRILLQVESKGEAWYVDPTNFKRTYLPDGNAAYSLLRNKGLGVKNIDLVKIPVSVELHFQDVDADGDGLSNQLEEVLGTNANLSDTDNDGHSDGIEVSSGYNPLGIGKILFDKGLANKLKGRILLQVEEKGQAWYVNPADGKMYYMQDGDNAYQIMKYLSLGITNNHLNAIAIDKTAGTTMAEKSPSERLVEFNDLPIHKYKTISIDQYQPNIVWGKTKMVLPPAPAYKNKPTIWMNMDDPYLSDGELVIAGFLGSEKYFSHVEKNIFEKDGEAVVFTKSGITETYGFTHLKHTWGNKFFYVGEKYPETFQAIGTLWQHRDRPDTTLSGWQISATAEFSQISFGGKILREMEGKVMDVAYVNHKVAYAYWNKTEAYVFHGEKKLSWGLNATKPIRLYKVNGKLVAYGNKGPVTVKKDGSLIEVRSSESSKDTIIVDGVDVGKKYKQIITPMQIDDDNIAFIADLPNGNSVVEVLGSKPHTSKEYLSKKLIKLEKFKDRIYFLIEGEKTSRDIYDKPLPLPSYGEPSGTDSSKTINGKTLKLTPTTKGDAIIYDGKVIGCRSSAWEYDITVDVPCRAELPLVYFDDVSEIDGKIVMRGRSQYEHPELTYNDIGQFVVVDDGIINGAVDYFSVNNKLALILIKNGLPYIIFGNRALLMPPEIRKIHKVFAIDGKLFVQGSLSSYGLDKFVFIEGDGTSDEDERLKKLIQVLRKD